MSRCFHSSKKALIRLERVYVFCSLVDRRKKMHRETCDLIRNTFERVLHSAIPALSEIEQMGIAREPVAAFAHKSAAARAYQELWAEVEKDVLE